MLKKLLLTIPLFFLLAGCSFQSLDVMPANKPAPATNNEKSKSITLIIGEKKYQLESASQAPITAYDVLQKIAAREAIKIKTKQYSFGVFVEGIGDKIGDKNNFWLYYINDQLANTAIDNQPVKNGDTIKFIFTNNNPFNN